MIPYILLYMIGAKIGMGTSYNVLIGVGLALKLVDACLEASKNN